MATPTIIEAMLRSGVFKYGGYTIEEGSGNYWIVLDKSRKVRYRIENPTLKSGVIIRDMTTKLTVDSIEPPTSSF